MNEIDPATAPHELNALGHLASGVGHHVINAFSAIVSNAEILRLKIRSAAAPVDPAAVADMVIATAVEAATVARRLIDYTRPLTSIGFNQVRLDELIARYVAGRQAADGGEIAWLTTLTPVPPILGQPDHLYAMLDLLVENAVEASGSAPLTIDLATSVDPRGWVMLELRDSGRGMSSEVLERAVEPFFSTKSGHIGVGLSIANGIWRRHRGTLALKSEPGSGTTLRLCVEPLAA